MVEFYRWLHTHPEVSFEEAATAQYLAQAWKANGFQVTTGVGGHGIVGILKNGDGPQVMVRTDLDALPVTERTGLPFASTVKTTTKDGRFQESCTACGHDVHMTSVTMTASISRKTNSLEGDADVDWSAGGGAWFGCEGHACRWSLH